MGLDAVTLLTAWLLVCGFALLGVPLNRWRRDVEARHAAEARADRAIRRRQAETERADQAEEHARAWVAHADQATAELQRHLATCLGEKVTYDDSRCN